MTAPLYTFLPFVRRGAASALRGAIAGDAAGRAAIDLGFQVAGQPVVVPARVAGPGDATALDPRAVRRLSPPGGTREAEPYLFAAIDFAAADLPWLLTPGGPDADGRLAPWLVLAVVRADRSELTTAHGLARLVVERPGDELPDLTESWAWAHAQLVGRIDRPLAEIVDAQPERLTSRLVCARRLDPGVAWRACVVPAFAAGRAAGLGEPAPARPLDPAWDRGAPSATLPVYYHWEFATAAGADFETLVRRLAPRALPEQVGTLAVSAAAPGGGVRGIAEPLAIEGALRRIGAPFAPLPAAAAALVADLAAAIDRGADPLAVTAPLYGSDAAGVTAVPAAGWLRELNLDPRWRAVAGLGAEVVRREQADLMTAAWAQLGEVREANRVLDRLRLAGAIGAAIHRKHFARMSLDALIAITAPVHARVRLAGDASTLRTVLAGHLTAAPVVRRAARPTAPLGRALRGLAPPTLAPGPRAIAPLRPIGDGDPGGGTPDPTDPPPPPPDPGPIGLVTLERVFHQLGAHAPPAMRLAGFTAAVIDAVPHRDRFLIVDELGRGPGVPPPPLPLPAPFSNQDAAFRSAAHAHHARVALAAALAATRSITPLPRPIDRAQVLTALDPAPVFRDVQAGRIIVSPLLPPRGALDPVRGAPAFPQPVVYALARISEDHLLPGLASIPANTVAVMESNPRFVEAFLVGLNHEMARELAWREFPDAHRATYFHRFWDDRARPGGAGPGDIAEIAAWTPASALGDHALAAPVRAVVVIRGDVARSSPGILVSFVPSTATGAPDLAPAHEVHPVFRGGLPPDVLFAGFAIDPAALAAGYVVLRQQPTAPRFGLDASSPIAVAAVVRRNDLAWNHMPAGSHAAVAGPLAARTLRDQDPDDDPATPAETARWGRNAADMAWCTLQLPVRLIVPGKQLLP